jgi:hypothetical protein
MKPVSFSTNAFSNLIIAFQYSHFSSQKARLRLNGGKFSVEVMIRGFTKMRTKKGRQGFLRRNTFTPLSSLRSRRKSGEAI